MRLGELITIARECKGMEPERLEKAAGVSNALLSQIQTTRDLRR
jgi:transcriptional regulator with XRE-family HTH domain